ncbi:SGNH/GDSL hydrolase family protein [Scytonema sp. NUACC26]|uniref:SGNH/GDSL hydrolase family protein n=1 Tax=Scytonema sp. NUACC26 TaxID=3140176 RepID=UPI0038B394E0
MRRLFIAAVLALFSSIIVVALSDSIQSSNMIQVSHQINRLYVFGDSLSDVGNVYHASGKIYPPNPPYFEGRYSNGSVWIEYLSSKLAITPEQNSNFAYGGATTGNGSVNGIPGLLAQVQAFTKVHQEVNPNALYVLWAGANDYLYGGANPTLTVSNILKAIASLLKMGAKKILVVNLPDLGKVPATRTSANSNTLTSFTTAHNQILAKSVEELKQELGSDTQIAILDVYSLYQEATKHPTRFGLTNVMNACSNNLAICDNPNKYLFWDGIHPTTLAHQVIAEAALKVIKNEFLPATSPQPLS